LNNQSNLTKSPFIDEPPPLLSIIIPCFNSEDFIVEALESLSVFREIDLEIVIINDGSSDSTLSKIETFLANNRSIKCKIINQENMGPSVARNKGLEIASGEYLGFLDSDDIFLDNSVNQLLKILSSHQYDIIEFGFIRFNDASKAETQDFVPQYNLHGEYKVKDIITEIFAKTVWYSPIRIYRRSLWKNIRFDVNLIHSEDAATVPLIFYNASTIYFINSPIYGYRINKNSITSNHSIEQHAGIIHLYWIAKNNEAFDNIFNIRLARTISHFSFELKIIDNDYLEIRNDVSSLKVNMRSLSRMLLPDLMYYASPKIFDLLNKIRFSL